MEEKNLSNQNDTQRSLPVEYQNLKFQSELQHVITSTKEGWFSIPFVCLSLFVYLFVCLSTDIHETWWRGGAWEELIKCWSRSTTFVYQFLQHCKIRHLVMGRSALFECPFGFNLGLISLAFLQSQSRERSHYWRLNTLSLPCSHE